MTFEIHVDGNRKVLLTPIANENRLHTIIIIVISIINLIVVPTNGMIAIITTAGMVLFVVTSTTHAMITTIVRPMLRPLQRTERAKPAKLTKAAIAWQHSAIFNISPQGLGFRGLRFIPVHEGRTGTAKHTPTVDRLPTAPPHTVAHLP